MDIGLGIVTKPHTEVTLEYLKKQFPSKKHTIKQEHVDLITSAAADPLFNGDEFIKMLVEFKDVMVSNNASIKDYINAMKYCAYLESYDYNKTEAYKRARADDKFVQDRKDFKPGTPEYKSLSTAAHRYGSHTKIVLELLKRIDTPLYLMFQNERFEAVRVLYNEMKNADYAKDRINAADKLLTHVKPPENIQIDVGIKETKENSAVQQLNEQLAALALKSLAEIESGNADLKTLGAMKVKDSDILDAEVEEPE